MSMETRKQNGREAAPAGYQPNVVKPATASSTRSDGRGTDEPQVAASRHHNQEDEMDERTKARLEHAPTQMDQAELKKLSTDELEEVRTVALEKFNEMVDAGDADDHMAGFWELLAGAADDIIIKRNRS